MTQDIATYTAKLPPEYHRLCQQLAAELDTLPGATSKIWHGHPVWFLDGNPIAGYSLEKKGLRLMFWSGKDFDEPALSYTSGKYKDASIFYQPDAVLDLPTLRRWLEKGRTIQWDYKNIVKNRGVLNKL